MNKSNIIPRFSKIYRKFWSKKKISFGNYEIVEPANVSPIKYVPKHIKSPSYIAGHSLDCPEFPEVKSESQIIGMKNSCKLAANLLQQIGHFIQIGKTTDEIDSYAHDLIINHNAYPSPLNYKSFPKSICTSINNVACHGIPDDRPLKSGDIINIDITVFYNGYHGDCSTTFIIGDVDEVGRNLVKATETCLSEAIVICKPGLPFYQIGRHITQTAKKLGFTVVPCFTGHGIGSYFHGPPDIYHCENNYPGRMEPGMTFTIEPVLSQGSKEIVILDDGWTAVTIDNARTAQCEHTILITNSGVDVLTLPE